MKRAVVGFAILLVLLTTALAKAEDTTPPVPTSTDPALQGRLEPALLKQLLAAGSTEQLPVIVVMAEQAPAATGRGLVAESLQTTAERSQQNVRTFLAGEESAGHVSDVTSFWIFNGLALRAAPDTIKSLATRPDVDIVKLDHYENRLGPWQPTEAAPARELAWGVRQIRSDQAWSAFGDTGQGVVVATMDTGVDFLHPALNPNYRGNAGKGLYQHAGSWFDATPMHTSYPYDGQGHGTHTMGTLAGQDGTGVAPGARWIAVRVLDNSGSGYDSWIHAGFQWVLAPNGDPSFAPQVLSNSWGNDFSESTEFQADVARLLQAGILTVFSAGNNGPETGTIGSPASLPGVLAVGAMDADDQIASFSSRGPTPWGERKPQVTAPGVNVLSSIPGGNYALSSGTSMAAPHVAGILALMLSARPGLGIAEATYALTSTTTARTLPVPNNTTGWGRVDAYAAVQAVASAGEVTGIISDAATYLPLAGSTVKVHNLSSGADLSLETGADGRYRVALAAGRYSVAATRFSYGSETAAEVVVATGVRTVKDFALSPLPIGVLRGALTELGSSRPATATLSAVGTPAAATGTGYYEFDLPAGTYTIQAARSGLPRDHQHGHD